VRAKWEMKYGQRCAWPVRKEPSDRSRSESKPDWVCCSHSLGSCAVGWRTPRWTGRRRETGDRSTARSRRREMNGVRFEGVQ
jgi:hypothetical protein